jgi:hypothetical protein
VIGLRYWTTLVFAATVCAVSSGPVHAQMATADRLDAAGWWPTKGTAPQADYVGASTCAGCHAAKAALQITTSMARTARRAVDSEVLRSHKSLTFAVGPYAYAITTTGEKSVYMVSDGRRTLSADLDWAFGVGRVGQTFLFARGGTLHEARVSYFERLRALDFTPSRALTSPRDLEEAMSRPMPHSEVRRCFGCHMTAPTTEGTLNLAGLTTGITCEACHGPGRKHVIAIQQGRLDDGRAAFLNLRRLDPVDSVDFCGACHATYWDVKLAGEKGVSAMRSQPYRLQSSRCWEAGGRKMTCVTCHDPHQPLSRDARSYDARCFTCHASDTQGTKVRSCRVGRENCTTCHMPKYEVAEMHSAFTDHRIARPVSTEQR